MHALDDKTPLLCLIYATGSAKAPVQDTLDFVQAQVKTGYMVQIKCTTQEQALLRKLLFQNSKMIASDFKPALEPYEKNFKASFVMPIAPLSQVDIGKLTNDAGCAVCGKRTTSRCTGCLSVAYCGQGMFELDAFFILATAAHHILQRARRRRSPSANTSRSTAKSCPPRPSTTPRAN